MGWMTLHSVSTLYPENPSRSEQELMQTWLDMFRDTITCPHCKEHFTGMLQNYRMRFPNMLKSRQEFAMFAFRAHNAVNARLSKPVYSTLDECMTILRNNIKNRTAADYRISYINHIMRYWKSLNDITGIVAVKKVVEMKKIETDYCSVRDNKFDVNLVAEAVVIPRNWVEANSNIEVRTTPKIQVNSATPIRAGFQFTGGRMRLR